MKIPSNKISQIISLKKQYLSNNEISKRLKISLPTIRKYLREFFTDYEKYKLARSSEEMIKKMIDMKKERKTNREIALELNCTIQTVGRNLKKYMIDYEDNKPNKIPRNIIDKMIELKKKGKTNLKIGQLLDCDYKIVGAKLKIYMEDYEKYKLRRLSEEKIKFMIKLKRQGMTNLTISKELECDNKIVGKYLKKFMPDYNKYKLLAIRNERDLRKISKDS